VNVRSALGGLCLLFFCACAGPSGLPRAERTELCFGLAKPGGGVVTEREWQAFLDQEISPRFPDGLTVVAADGQYRGADGKPIREPSRLLILIHGGSVAEERRLGEIVELYKKAFSQESVLRVDQRVRAGF
jgi:hypothetical protein